MVGKIGLEGKVYIYLILGQIRPTITEIFIRRCLSNFKGARRWGRLGRLIPLKITPREPFLLIRNILWARITAVQVAWWDSSMINQGQRNSILIPSVLYSHDLSQGGYFSLGRGRFDFVAFTELSIA